MASSTLLLVEDNLGDARLIRAMLDGPAGPLWQLERVERLSMALHRLPAGGIEVMLLDLTLPDAHGVQAVNAVCQAFPALPVVVLTGLDDETTGLEALHEGAQDYLVKGHVDPEGLVRSLRHAIERKRSEEQLRFQAQLLDSVQHGLVALDRDRSVLYWNPTLERLHGAPAALALGQDVLTLMTAEPERAEAEKALTRAQAGPAWTGQLRLRRATGEAFPALVSASRLLDHAGAARGLILDVLDISERERQEEALRNAQKMESLGVLAGGVAHDFNNLLGIILGFDSLALARLPADSPARKPIERSIGACQQASELTRQILAYAGRARFEVKPLELNPLIRHNLHLFELGLPKSVTLSARLSEPLPLVEADGGQLQQVLMNLILNAAEAIGQGQGAVTLSTSTRRVPPEPPGVIPGQDALAEGEYVCLEVADDGCGMDETTVARIFDPFFTTKFAGRGLGLAAVLGIVRGHKGRLAVETAPGRGTKFLMLLPVSSRQLERSRPASERREARRATVLVIDDEEALREIAKEILELEGFSVVTAADGTEGLELYERRKGEIGLVVLDLSMPGLGGAETFARLKAMDSSARVLLTSGYHEVEATPAFVQHGLTGFIQKPFTPEALAAEVRKCLGTGEAV